MARHFFASGAVALVAALIASGIDVRADDVAEKAKSSVKIAAESAYLQDTLEGAHQLGVTAMLAGANGKGTLTLDPNTCSLDDFGDPQICTRIAVRSVPVELKQVQVADPTGAGRRLYEVVGAGLESQLLLVVPSKGGAMRFVSQDGNGVKRVVTLEPVGRGGAAAANGQAKAPQRKSTGLAAADTEQSAKSAGKGDKAAIKSSAGKKQGTQLLTGTSEKLSFEEALKNALAQVKLPFPDALLEYSIAGMGGEVGGITGKQNLSITIQVHVK